MQKLGCLTLLLAHRSPHVMTPSAGNDPPTERAPSARRAGILGGMLAGLYWTVAQPVESRLGCWPGDKCDFACALRNIRASCGDEGVGMVPPSLMHHDGSPECQWCSNIADDKADIIGKCSDASIRNLIGDHAQKNVNAYSKQKWRGVAISLGSL